MTAPARAAVGLLPATGALARQKILAALRSGEALFAVFGPIAVRGDRRAAEQR